MIYIAETAITARAATATIKLTVFIFRRSMKDEIMGNKAEAAMAAASASRTISLPPAPATLAGLPCRDYSGKAERARRYITVVI